MQGREHSANAFLDLGLSVLKFNRLEIARSVCLLFECVSLTGWIFIGLGFMIVGIIGIIAVTGFLPLINSIPLARPSCSARFR